jgi:hypothetical protein
VSAEVGSAESGPTRRRRFAGPRSSLVLIAGAAALVVLAIVTALRREGDVPTQLGTTVDRVDPLDNEAPLGDGRLWFVADGGLPIEASSPRRTNGSPIGRSTVLHLHNPGEESAAVLVRFYRSTGAPTGISLDVDAGKLVQLDLTTRDDVPVEEPYWIVVQANAPIFAQAELADHRPWDPVPDALSMVMPQPGAMDARDLAWIYPDGFQGGTESWHEDETLTLLNPWPVDANVTITYRFRDGRRPKAQQVVAPAERVVAFGVGRTPDGDDAFEVSGDFAVLVTADRPVASQKTRRARWRGEPHVSAALALTPIPLAVAERTREWHYAGGWTRDLGLLPRDDYTIRTWQLLFTHGLRTSGDVEVQVAWHTAREGASGDTPIRVPAERSDLQWLHNEPWLERLGLDAPWALVMRTEHPVAPSATSAEFGPWSQGLPGAMAAATLVPGPLGSGHRRWWMGVVRHGGHDDRPADWDAAWQLFNPAAVATRATLRFGGLPGGALVQAVDVPAGGVVRVTGDDVTGLPPGEPFVVVVEATHPVVAHTWLRVAARGVAGTRAMTSLAGLPAARVP